MCACARIVWCAILPQPGVRAASLETLNAWYNELTINPLIEQELIANALSTESPNLRTEVHQSVNNTLTLD